MRGGRRRRSRREGEMAEATGGEKEVDGKRPGKGRETPGKGREMAGALAFSQPLPDNACV
eukprot:161094-Pyramimonas_sp.AAC.1